ncbi:hypothetical protein [Lachnoclostridium sp. An76]|uniref:hypothetical protein n=1 Tax=Lachnoclostridium sp. An76 TaxID=1965654 RepID=UPI000B37C739|nr:hypothetical protein [Lachnoclostridium sp. An76]OUN33658.1 hypothetical protein B5G27_11630 [Lachnoclostridium sp. An76]
MEKQGHPTKIGAIGTNVPKNTEEKEEDFLETIFSRWRSGKAMRLTDFAMETGENKAHLFFVKYFSLKKASEFPFFSKGFSLPSAGIMHPCA